MCIRREASISASRLIFSVGSLEPAAGCSHVLKSLFASSSKDMKSSLTLSPSGEGFWLYMFVWVGETSLAISRE